MQGIEACSKFLKILMPFIAIEEKRKTLDLNILTDSWKIVMRLNVYR